MAPPSNLLGAAVDDLVSCDSLIAHGPRNKPERGLGPRHVCANATSRPGRPSGAVGGKSPVGAAMKVVRMTDFS